MYNKVITQLLDDFKDKNDVDWKVIAMMLADALNGTEFSFCICCTNYNKNVHFNVMEDECTGCDGNCMDRDECTPKKLIESAIERLEYIKWKEQYDAQKEQNTQ